MRHSIGVGVAAAMGVAMGLGGCAPGPKHAVSQPPRHQTESPAAASAPEAARGRAIAEPAAPHVGPSAGWSEIGRSRQGRVIEARNVGHGPLRLYLIGAIHGDEAEGRRALDAVVRTLQSPRLSGLATVRIVRDMNPDGAAKGVRSNAAGRDLNRNWPAQNFSARGRGGDTALSEPETRGVHTDMEAFAPAVVVVFHSSPSGPFVNYDGPAAALARAFADAAKAADPRWSVKPDIGYRTPGSMGSYVGVDRGVPILTIEFARGKTAELAAVAGMRAVVGSGGLAVVQ